jgi:hypothetical protein
MIGTANLAWEGDRQLLGRRLLATLRPEPHHPGLWRIWLPDGSWSADFYNRARAKENAMALVLAEINGKKAAA